MANLLNNVSDIHNIDRKIVPLKTFNKFGVGQEQEKRSSPSPSSSKVSPNPTPNQNIVIEQVKQTALNGKLMEN